VSPKPLDLLDVCGSVLGLDLLVELACLVRCLVADDRVVAAPVEAEPKREMGETVDVVERVAPFQSDGLRGSSLRCSAIVMCLCCFVLKKVAPWRKPRRSAGFASISWIMRAATPCGSAPWVAGRLVR
jgi:hypothetical protein